MHRLFLPRYSAGPILSLLIIVGCGPENAETQVPAVVQEAMDWKNDPHGVPGATGTLDYFLADLPKKGAASHDVWRGSDWPFAMGGVAWRYRDDLSPLEKYDKITNQSNAATIWEKQQATKFRGISWAGHCNGLAAASTMTHNPQKAVTFRGVTFSQQDIQGLLTEAWQGGGQVIGGRCNKDARNLKRDADGRFVDPDCRGLNPATFHLVLTNFLGRWRLPVIMDRSVDKPVWNYVAKSYEVSQQTERDATAAAGLFASAGGRRYPHNEDAVYFMEYHTKVWFGGLGERTYHYLLEGDRYGNIIGGEWLGDSINDHPDFVWRHTRPQPDNPYLDLAIVKEIYRLSLAGTPFEI